MANKIFVLGDLHFGCRNDNEAIRRAQIKFFKQCLFPYLKQHNIKEGIQLGDLFDKRKMITHDSAQLAKDVLFDPIISDGIDLTVLAGNHDCRYKNTNQTNSIRLLLENTEYFHIVDRYASDIRLHKSGKYIYTMPWINDENYDDTISGIDKTESNIAVGHLELAGFNMYKGVPSNHGMDPKPFSKFDLVLSGHYHTHSKKGNIVYTGVPYEMTWSDYDDPKGFWILDVDTLDLEFVENPYTVFAKLYYDGESGEATDLDQIDLTDKYVKLIVTTNKDPKKLEKYVSRINEKGYYDLVIIEQNANNTVKDIEEDKVLLTDTKTLIDSYVDSINDLPLDPERLKMKMGALYLEAQENADIS